MINLECYIFIITIKINIEHALNLKQCFNILNNCKYFMGIVTVDPKSFEHINGNFLIQTSTFLLILAETTNNIT